MQCQWIKSDGEQCRRRAVAGESYCSTHLRMSKAAGGDEHTSPPLVKPAKGEVVTVAAIHSNRPVALRFIGKGSYSIPSEDIYFYEQGQVLTVSHSTWLRLLEEQPDSFEEA